MTVKDDIKDTEKEAVQELRKRLKSDIETELYDDFYFFHRFLKARDFDVNNAEVMIRKHLEWREKHDIKNICNFKIPEVVEKYCPYTLMGYDKEGCAIRFCPVGNIDFIGIISSCKFEEMINVIINFIESDSRELKKQSEKLGKNVDKCVYIADLKNLSFAQVTDKKSIYVLISLLNLYINNYPERLKAAYVLNSSMYFNLIYSLIKTILPKTVMDKIYVYSDDSYKEDILKVIDADVLPAFLGGSRTDPDGNPLCKTILNHAGESVPDKYFIHRSKRSLSKLPGSKKVTLGRAAFHEVNLAVKEPGSYLEWEFETKCRDIGFGLFYNEVIDGEEKITELVPIQRIDTEEYPETGTLKCDKTGTYVILFDNTYSWIRAKEIYYRVKIVTPQELEAEIKD